MKKIIISISLLVLAGISGGNAPNKDYSKEAILERFDISQKEALVTNFKNNLMNIDFNLYLKVDSILKFKNYNCTNKQYALIKTAEDLKIKAEWLLFVIHKESSGYTDIKNPISNAVGIIQWLPKTASYLGYDTNTIKNMSFEEQLDLAKKYLLKTGKLEYVNSYEDLYMTIFFPLAVGKKDGYIIGKKGSKVVLQNRAIDINKDGIITVKDFKEYAKI